MSSALKSAITPSGAQNPAVPSQLNKPMHQQNVPTTYGQPMSHIPQNLVNISSSPAAAHNPSHSNAHPITHVNTHGTNHYSLNVPNASQHYPISGSASVSSHPTPPASNHPVSNPNQPTATYTASPAKSTAYTANYQTNLGNSYKAQNAVSTTVTAQTPQTVTVTSEEPRMEKPQSNGTPEVKTSKSEPSQNHLSTSSPNKDKPPSLLSVPDKAKVTPETSIVVASVTPTVEQQSTIANKTDIVSTSTHSDKGSPATGSGHSASTSPASVSSPASISTSTTASVTTTTPTSVSVQQAGSSKSGIQESQDLAHTTAEVNKPKEQFQNNQKSTLKLATTPRNIVRKAKAPKSEALGDSLKPHKSETKSSNPKFAGGKTKRTRTKTQPYQSPLPEVEMISKISATTPKIRNNEDKLIIFYKNEFLAVRNSEGGFYVCQAVQNVYKSSPRIKIRWLSQDKGDKEVYSPDFYDYTDFDCILTNLNLERVGKGKYRLPGNERIRTDSILKRALAVEKGDVTPPPLTEEHPDGLDLSLYKEESQLKKRKAVKRKASAALRSLSKASNIKKSPDQSKVRKVAPKPIPQPVKKSAVIKKALSTKAKKLTGGRPGRTAKRQSQDSPKISIVKTSPIIDQKKAKVLAKVARKSTPAKQSSSKQSMKVVKSAPIKKSATKKLPVVATTSAGVSTTRKSKRGRK